ncbi:glycosyltransferase family 2 protein [Massilibacteroides vaginae]|uniref:glycosyltransferase family 2 protein n=1 Tax=Massilibacteroides vaginae TaxID=1673718 RepID=UPI000A1C9796|nr:glycosyltransferase family 2 protein [Massilibacteroides vaginae]
MKVSIIIPIYNVEAYIDRCLTSAFNQSYPHIEFVCIDDGSKDNSVKIAEKAINKSDRKKDVIFIINPMNNGVAATRNIGLQQATGDYIFFLDSDDELPSDAIECLIKANNSINADIIMGDFSMTGAHKRDFKTIQLQDGCYRNEEILDTFLLMKWSDMTCNKMVRLDTIRKNNIFFENNIIHEDTLWSFILAVESSLMIICNQRTYIYHIQDQSITQKKTDHNFNSLLIVLNKIISITMEKKIFEKNNHINDYLIDYCFYFLKESFRYRGNNSLSKEVFKNISAQLHNFKSITKNTNWSSKIKFILLKLPFNLSFFVFKLYLFIKR